MSGEAYGRVDLVGPPEFLNNGDIDMPAVSQAQRGYLAVHFGKEWMKEHHFDNPGKLPKYAKKTKKRKRAKR